jgi:transcriptional regulator with GAF, ATPase, and Fis domain
MATDGDDADEVSTFLQKPAERALDVAPGAVFRFVVAEGPDRGLAFSFDSTVPSRVLIGQSPSCDLRLTDRQVSRRHASLELSHRGLLLTDLQSKNGTAANGMPVVAVYLAGGEFLRMGETTLRVDCISESAPVRLPEAMRFGRMIGASAEMRRLYPKCKRIALSDVPVIIEGETGTGKEVLAEALHEASPRAKGPFVVFDCTTAPASLLESALFGHERGAFTGAVASKRGVFEEASGGTLFIDEIGELELSLQPKLLRAIERSEVQRVGATQWTRVDVRIITATRRDIDHEVQVGRFRDDLYYRLAVARIELPPLRSRSGDVGVLARQFWHTLGGEGTLPASLVARLEDYAWPGNVRELYNVIARYVAMGDVELASPGRTTDESTSASAPPPSQEEVIAKTLALDLPLARARQLVVEEFERRYIDRILERYDGNVVRAAAASGIARRYFQILRARRKPARP